MTTAATTISSKKAEANRRNARKSTGPRTPEGKDRSKFNALKDGLSAKTLVLPGEDAGAFQDRLDAWAADLQPRNDVEHVLVERSATLSWQLERADRADAARLASILGAAPAEEALRQADRAAALGQRLFQDPAETLPLYPHSLYGTHDRPRISDSGLGDDPDAPARLLLQLESTAADCGWLLDRWGELGDLLDRGLSWQSPDKLKAIRLLGRQPLDAADSEVVALIFQACHVLDPQVPARLGRRAEPGADPGGGYPRARRHGKGRLRSGMCFRPRRNGRPNIVRGIARSAGSEPGSVPGRRAVDSSRHRPAPAGRGHRSPDREERTHDGSHS
jgi:hypothetical protein